VSSGYFAEPDELGSPTRGPEVHTIDDLAAVQLGPGLSAVPVTGADCMLTYVTWDERGFAPAHAHAEEQLVLVLEGAVELGFDEDARVLSPGQIAVIPPWVRHSARARASRCVTVEVFSPPRAALLALLQASS
jgi:quercetin dioxygenase-like cupin family protein